MVNNFLKIDYQWGKKIPVSDFLPLDEKHVEEQETVVQESTYGSDDRELQQFLVNHPKNTERDIVISKILRIDYTNSTNLQMYRKNDVSIFTLADRILSIENLDDDIRNGAPKAVNDIADTGMINLFSFASKYCCYHNRMVYDRDDYSIYDTVVANTIPQYLNVKRAYIDKCRTELDFQSYQKILDRLIAVHGLQEVPNIRRKIDHFLWFPNKGKKRK